MKASLRHPPRLSYPAQQRLSLLLVALIPLVAFAAIALSRVQAAIAADADARISDAARSVDAVLQSKAAQLAATTDSYATWSVLQDQVAGLETNRLQSEALDFLVQSGAVDVAELRIGAQRLSSGPAAAAAALEAGIGPRLTPATSGSSSGLVNLGDAIYQVSVERIDLSGLSGPGVAAASAGGAWIALASRLGSAFVLDARRLTGFDVAVYNAAGNVLVTSDLAAARQLAPLPPGTAPGSAPELERRGTTLAALVPLTDPSGKLLGSLATTTDLSVLSTINEALIPLLVLALALAVVVALSLAVYLAERLHYRIRAVEAGISAVAAGDLSVRLPVDGRDELSALAASHNRLSAELERRDGVLRQSQAALAALTPEMGAAAVERQGLVEAERIFGLHGCRLEPDAAVAAASATALRMPIGDHETWLVSSVAPGSGWSEADRAALEAFARQLGAAIHDAERLEETARRADALDRVNRLQADFLRGVSHNLQTPLTKILALTDDLRAAAAADLSPFVRERVEVVWAEARRLAQLVAQLLTLSRLEAGAFRPEEELCAVPPLLRRAWAGLTTDRELVIADRSGGALAIADRSAVEQIFWILLDNACRYAPRGTVTARLSGAVAAKARGTTRRLTVRVEDEGPGVPIHERERIFGRFVRGSTSTGHDGTGLGLDVARGLAEAMGGTLVCEGAPGGGAAFVLTLPAELPEAEASSGPG